MVKFYTRGHSLATVRPLQSHGRLPRPILVMALCQWCIRWWPWLVLTSAGLSHWLPCWPRREPVRQGKRRFDLNTKRPIGNLCLRTEIGNQDGAIANFDTTSMDLNDSSELVKGVERYTLVTANILVDRISGNIPLNKEFIYTSLTNSYWSWYELAGRSWNWSSLDLVSLARHGIWLIVFDIRACRANIQKSGIVTDANFRLWESQCSRLSMNR